MWFIKLGSVVKGPFTEDQLAAMLSRGEFSKSHLVSSNRQQWEQAGFLVELIERKIRSQPMHMVGVSGGQGTETKEWYYSNDGQKQGPFAIREIKSLIRDRVIVPETNVYSNQSKSWVEARDVPQLASDFKTSQNIAPMIAAVVMVPIVAMVVIFLMMRTDNGSFIPPPGEPNSDVLSERLEQKLTSATGLVYLCTKCVIGGKSMDISPLSSGTCFLVTKEGGAITNRHVVDIEALIAGNPEIAKLVASEKAACEKSGGQYSIATYVFFGELVFELKVLKMSDHFDLAICKIDRQHECECLPLSKSAAVRRTQKVYSIGFPGLASQAATKQDAVMKALLQRDKTSINEMVLPYERVHTISDGSVERVTEFADRIKVVQHNAKIFHGNSGGPLVKADGAVIGINTFGKTDKENVGSYLFSPEISQMRREIDEYMPGQVSWVN